jgi:hypothetical protein
LKARYEAQGLLLAAANKEVFELKTQIKENQHKIDRLHDYEKQIEALVKVERTWYEHLIVLFRLYSPVMIQGMRNSGSSMLVQRK